jgi:arsenite oxidase small subunit
MSSDSVENEKSESKSPDDNSDESRRNLLKIGLGIGAVLVLGGVGAVAKTLINPGAQLAPTTQTTTTGTTSSSTLPPPATPGFPVIKIANLSDIVVGTPITFNYPLEETPNILVKLGQKAEGGVGPDNDIVAFSQVCQHLGCIYAFLGSGSSPTCNSSYKASGPVGYCCCHGSIYDLANGAKVIGGPAPRPEPQVILSFDSSTGNIYATGMTPPTIFGYNTGSNDVSSDLQGGTLVS